MEELVNKLTGRLIGIARATEGNEHMVTASTADMVVQGLAATFPTSNSAEETLRMLYHRADDEKRKLVPDCYNCMASCGRNNNYDMQRLQRASEDVRNLKNLILLNTRLMGVCVRRAAQLGRRDEQIYSFLYKGLFSVGMDDWEAEDLLPILREAAEGNLKCVRLLDDTAREKEPFLLVNGVEEWNPELLQQVKTYTFEELTGRYPQIKL